MDAMTSCNELRLIGSRVLSTRLGRQVIESKVFDSYYVPVLVAQDIIKAAGSFNKQLTIFSDYLNTLCQDGYWIATTDPEDEGRFTDLYGMEISDQYITKIVVKGSQEFEDVHDMHTSLGAISDPYSYILVSEMPESEYIKRRVAKLVAEEYDLDLQVA